MNDDEPLWSCNARSDGQNSGTDSSSWVCTATKPAPTANLALIKTALFCLRRHDIVSSEPNTPAYGVTARSAQRRRDLVATNRSISNTANHCWASSVVARRHGVRGLPTRLWIGSIASTSVLRWSRSLFAQSSEHDETFRGHWRATATNRLTLPVATGLNGAREGALLLLR
jgi:hypothetical protein